MTSKRKARNQRQVGNCRHDDARRKNNPPAGIAPTYEARERQATCYTYDSLTGEVHSDCGENVAAWFLDTDYDGMTFHICQAILPRKRQGMGEAPACSKGPDRSRGI